MFKNSNEEWVVTARVLGPLVAWQSSEDVVSVSTSNNRKPILELPIGNSGRFIIESDEQIHIVFRPVWPDDIDDSLLIEPPCLTFEKSGENPSLFVPIAEDHNLCLDGIRATLSVIEDDANGLVDFLMPAPSTEPTLFA